MNLLLLVTSLVLFTSSFWVEAEGTKTIRWLSRDAGRLTSAYMIAMLTIWRLLCLGLVYFTIATWP